jgi:hypothetical protein
VDPTDVTVEILKSIRDEIRGLRQTTNDRFESMERRQTETEIRLATELVAVASAVNEVRDLLRDHLIPITKDHERRITTLEEPLDTDRS